MTCVIQGAQAPSGFNGLGGGELTVPVFDRSYGPIVYSSRHGALAPGRGNLHKASRHQDYFHHLSLNQSTSSRGKYEGMGEGVRQSMPWMAPASSVQSSFQVQSSNAPSLPSPAFYSSKMHTHFHGQGQVACVSTRCRVDPADSTRQYGSVESENSTQCLCCVDSSQFLHPSTGSTRGRNTDWSFSGRQVKQQKYGFAPIVRNGGGDISNLTTPFAPILRNGVGDFSKLTTPFAPIVRNGGRDISNLTTPFAPIVRNVGGDISNLTTPLSVDCSVEYEMPCLPSIPPDSAPILQVMSTSDLSKKGSCHKSSGSAPLATHGSHGSKLSDLTRLEAVAPPSQLAKPPQYNWTQAYQNTMASKTPCHNTMATRTPSQHATMCLHDTMGGRTPCHSGVYSHGPIMGVMEPMYNNAMGARLPSHQTTYCDSVNSRSSSQVPLPYYVDNMNSRTFSHPTLLVGNPTETSNPNAIRTRPDISHSVRIGTRPATFHPILMETRQHISQPDISHPTKRETHPTGIGIFPGISKPRTLRRQHVISYPRPHISHPPTTMTRPHILPIIVHPSDTLVTRPHTVGNRPDTVGTKPDIFQPNLGLTVGCIPMAGSPGTDILQHVMEGVHPTLQLQAGRDGREAGREARRDGRQTAGNKRKLNMPSSTPMEQLEQCARPIYLETNRKLGDSDGLQSVQSTQSGSIKRQRLSYPGVADINQAAGGGTVWPHNAYYSSRGVNNVNLGYMEGPSRGFYRDIRYGFHSF